MMAGLAGCSTTSTGKDVAARFVGMTSAHAIATFGAPDTVIKIGDRQTLRWVVQKRELYAGPSNKKEVFKDQDGVHVSETMGMKLKTRFSICMLTMHASGPEMVIQSVETSGDIGACEERWSPDGHAFLTETPHDQRWPASKAIALKLAGHTTEFNRIL
jgi:hypothetical protein